jgi:sensor c-di-GMP phosphodiesterase-like protein
MALKNKQYQRVLKFLAAFLVAAMVFIFGIGATWYQVNFSDKKEARYSANEAIIRIDSLLSEAEQTATFARPWLSKSCDTGSRVELQRLAIGAPHLRIIGLLHGDYLFCSSFQISKPYTVDFKKYADNRLNLVSNNAITPMSSAVILLTTFPEGTVSSSISTVHMVNILSLLSDKYHLTLQIGQRFLSEQGRVVIKIGCDISVHSTKYPYSVCYNSTFVSPIDVLVHKSKIQTILCFLLAISAGALTWQTILKPPSLSEKLAKAIRLGEITPWYQPIICSQTGEIHGVEVLARWITRSGIHIPPDEFIPLAEKNGLILPLTQSLMERVVADLTPIVLRIPSPFHIGFNISTAHIREKTTTLVDFGHFQSCFPPGCVKVVVEITEREQFEASPALDELLSAFHNMECQIAIDDFGTGYSNFGYLNTLSVDYIKIDHSFINRITPDGKGDQLVECVINMAQALGMEIVAEGVETEYQVAWLLAKKVELLQGYYFSRPLPLSHFVRMVVLQKKRFRMPPQN